MNKTIILVLALVLVAYSQIIPCIGEECTGDAGEGSSSSTQLQAEAQALDNQLKQVFWFYLRDSITLYQASVNTGLEPIHLFIYRNTLATCLTIASWDHEIQRIKSKSYSIIVIGNGLLESVDDQQTVNINPRIRQLFFSDDEVFLYSTDGVQSCQYTQGKCFDIEIHIPYQQLQEKTMEIKQALSNTFASYLKDTIILRQYTIVTNKKVHTAFIHVSLSETPETYLSYCSYDGINAVSVKSFIRLGTATENIFNEIKVTINQTETQLIYPIEIQTQSTDSFIPH